MSRVAAARYRAAAAPGFRLGLRGGRRLSSSGECGPSGPVLSYVLRGTRGLTATSWLTAGRQRLLFEGYRTIRRVARVRLTEGRPCVLIASQLDARRAPLCAPMRTRPRVTRPV